MNRFDFFWKTMKLCDWSHARDDEQVLLPVVQHLASRTDAEIFAFEDRMAELLHSLDTRELAECFQRANGAMSDDGFLYARCAALVNGRGYYKKVLAGKCREIWELEFEALLYVPHKAWAARHGQEETAYPHIPPVSYETGHIEDGWQ